MDLEKRLGIRKGLEMSMIILLKIQDSWLSQDISDRRGNSFRLTSFLSESGSKMSSYNEVDFVN